MSTRVKLKLGSSVVGKAVVFAETETGKFSAVVDSTDYVTVESSGTSLRAAAVTTVAGYYVSSWNVEGGGTQYNGVVTWKNTSTATVSYPLSVTGTSSTTKVTVVDDHGTHLGTPTGTGSYNKNCVGVKHATTDDGYTFTGWTVTLTKLEGSSSYKMLSTGGTKSGNVYTFGATDDAIVFQLGSNGNVTFTANYEQEAPDCTLTYDANGGSSTPASQSAKSGSSVVLAAAITKPGYTFAGWKIGSVVYAAGSSYKLTSSVTATAQWTEDSDPVYTVTFDKNASGASGDDLPSVMVTSGGSITLPEATLWEYDGYSFTGWSKTAGATTASYSVGDSVSITGDTTFYAVWAKTSGLGGKCDKRSIKVVNGKGYTTEYELDGYDFRVYTNVSSAAVRVEYSNCSQPYWRETSAAYDPRYVSWHGKNPLTTDKVVQQQGSTWTEYCAPSLIGTSVTCPSPGPYYYSYYKTTNANGNSKEDSWTVNTVFKSVTIGSDWAWTAPELDGFDFVGWFTIGRSYSADEYHDVDSGSEFTVKICTERKFIFTDLLAKVNYVEDSVTDISRADGGYDRKYYYTNYIQVRYLGVKVLVLFDANGGDLDDFYREVRYDQAYGSLPTPTWGDHTFLGWFTAAADGTQVTADTVVSTYEEHVLYAHWEGGGSSGGETEADYTIWFDANGGTCSTTSKTVTSGSAVGALPTPTASGCVFDGWRDADGMQYTAVSIMPASDLTLTASWTLSPVTVTFDANGGTCAMTSLQVQPGDAVGSLPTATKVGAGFAGWFTAASGGTRVSSSTTFSSSTTVYAQWGVESVPPVIVKYKIVLDLGGGTLDSAYVCKYTMGVVKTLPTASQVAKSGATFAGWFETSDFSGSAVTQIPSTATGTKTFYAKWA